MMASGYEYRFVVEYKQLCDRLSKLHRMVTRYRAGNLNFEPDCPLQLLMDQEKAMNEYKSILEVRAEIEGIDLC